MKKLVSLAGAILFLLIETVRPECVCATDYQVNVPLTVTTFDQSADYNGTPITLSATDTVIMGGSVFTVSGPGSGTAYSALIGSGSGIDTGFSWGTGGTVSVGTDTVLTVNTAAGSSVSPVSLSKQGSGSLLLASGNTQYLNITLSAGTLESNDDVNMTAEMTMSGGTFTVNGDLFAGNGTSISAGDINVNGTYTNSGTQSTVAGTISSQSVNYENGGLYVQNGGVFETSGDALFSAQTAIHNLGTVTIEGTPTIQSSSTSNFGSMNLGSGAVFSNILGNAGTIIIQGSAEFGLFYNYGTVTITGDAVFNSEFYNESGTLILDSRYDYYQAEYPVFASRGNMLINGDGTFNDSAEITGTLNVVQNAEFKSNLTVNTDGIVSAGSVSGSGIIAVNGGAMNVSANTTAASIDVVGGTFIGGGNINTTGSFTVSGSSTLGLSNKLIGTNLGDLTAGTTVNLASDTVIQTDLSGLLDVKGQTLLIHMTADGSTDNFLIDGAVTDTTAVANLFGSSSPLRKIYAVDNGAGYDIYADIQSLGDYAQQEGLLPPAIEAGNAVDDMLGKVDPSNPVYDMIDGIYNETDKNVINQTLYNLAGGYGVENIFALSLFQLGEAGSPFFQGRATGIARKEVSCGPDEHFPMKKHEVWGAPFYQSMSAGGNFFQHGYNAWQTGVMIGTRYHFSCEDSAGLLFAYGAPRLRQSGSLSGYEARFNSRLNLDNYQFAAHYEHAWTSDWRLSLFAGGSALNMKLDRHAWGTSANDLTMDRYFDGDTTGNTFMFTAYLSKKFEMAPKWSLTPAIGFDSAHVWLFSFNENSTGTGDWESMNNLSEGNFYSPVLYHKTQCDRNSARIGFWSEYEGDRNGLSLQAFYGTQLGGNDAAVVPVTTLGGVFDNQIYGYGIGRDSLNLGGGGWTYLNELQTAVASVNYNYYTFNHSQGMNVTAAVDWRY